MTASEMWLHNNSDIGIIFLSKLDLIQFRSRKRTLKKSLILFYSILLLIVTQVRKNFWHSGNTQERCMIHKNSIDEESGVFDVNEKTLRTFFHPFIFFCRVFSFWIGRENLVLSLYNICNKIRLVEYEWFTIFAVHTNRPISLWLKVSEKCLHDMNLIWFALEPKWRKDDGRTIPPALTILLFFLHEWMGGTKKQIETFFA